MITVDEIQKGGEFTIYWPGQEFTYKFSIWKNAGITRCSVSTKVGVNVRFVGFLNIDTFTMNLQSSYFAQNSLEVRALCRALARIVAQQEFPAESGIKVA